MSARQAESGPNAAILALCVAAGVTGTEIFARNWFLAGAGLVLASVVLLRWPGRLWDVADPPELSRQTRLLCLAAIVAVAALFRFHRMTPPGLWGDDAINGVLALDVLDGKIKSPFQIIHHSISRMHALTNYIIAGTFQLFGADLWTLRLPGVVLSLLGVPLLYFTCAPLFGARVALAAALFCATSPVQVSHGKILLQVVTGQFFLLLSLCLLVRGARGRRPWMIPLAGAPLALSLCTYLSLKLAPAIAVFAIIAAVSGGHRPRRLGLWLVAAMVVLIASAAPGMLAYVDDPQALTGRFDNTSSWAGGLPSMWDSLWRTLAIFHYQQGPRQVNWVGIGYDPALGGAVALLACHGLVQSLRRIRDPRHLFLLAWFGLGLLPGILSSEAPRIYRVLLATPPVFLWAALPLERMMAWARDARRVGRVVTAVATSAVVGLILVAQPVVDFDYYFHRVYSNYDYNWTQATRMVEIAELLRARGPGWRGHLLVEGFDTHHDTMRFLSRVWSLDLQDAASLADFLPPRDGTNSLLLFDGTTLPVLDSLHAFYPDAPIETRELSSQQAPWFERLLTPSPAPPPRPLAASLAISADAVAAQRGIDAHYLDANGRPLFTRVWPQLALQSGVDEPAEAARVVLSGSLYAPRSGSYSFALDDAAGAATTLPASVLLDGRPLLSTLRPRTEIDLAEGYHPLAASLELEAAGTFDIRWKPPAEAEGSIPAANLWRRPEAPGWLVEYTNPYRSVRRLETIPFYNFFPRTFDGHYAVHWRGRLLVPEGGRFLEIRSRTPLTVLIDGSPWEQGKLVDAGEHAVDLTAPDVDRAHSLIVMFRRQGEAPALAPPSAFLPPAS